MIDEEDVLGRLLNRRGNPVAMPRSENQRLQDEEIERALQELNAVGSHTGRETTSIPGVCLLVTACHRFRVSFSFSRQMNSISSVSGSRLASTATLHGFV